MPSLGAQTNYHGNTGNWVVFVIARGLNANDPQPNGVFYTGSVKITFQASPTGRATPRSSANGCWRTATWVW